MTWPMANSRKLRCRRERRAWIIVAAAEASSKDHNPHLPHVGAGAEPREVEAGARRLAALVPEVPGDGVRARGQRGPGERAEEPPGNVVDGQACRSGLGQRE